MKEINWNLYIRIGFVIALILLGLIFSEMLKLKRSKDELEKMYKTSEKQTEFYKDELGRATAKIEAVQTQNVEDFVNAIFSDPSMKKLQEQVNFAADKLKKGGSVTVTESGTTINNITQNTVMDDGARFTEFKDPWIEYRIVSTKDSTKLDLETRDLFTTTIGFEKDKSLPWLKRQFSDPLPYSWVTTESPYNKIKETKSYVTKMDKSFPRGGFGLQAGYGLMAPNLEPTFYIGFGYSYQLFRF